MLDTHFVRVFKASQHISSLSDGLFDCTVAPLVEAWGFGPNGTRCRFFIHSHFITTGRLSDLWLRGDSLLSNPQQKTMDFNALAQGYTVDVIAELLDSNLVSDYLIELGENLEQKGTIRETKMENRYRQTSNDIDVNDRFQIILKLQNKS